MCDISHDPELVAAVLCRVGDSLLEALSETHVGMPVLIRRSRYGYYTSEIGERRFGCLFTECIGWAKVKKAQGFEALLMDLPAGIRAGDHVSLDRPSSGSYWNITQQEIDAANEVPN